MQNTPDQNKAQDAKQLAPKEIKKLAQKGIPSSSKVNPQQNFKNLKLVVNQAQSKPAILRRNSPNQG